MSEIIFKEKSFLKDAPIQFTFCDNGKEILDVHIPQTAFIELIETYSKSLEKETN